MILFISYIVGYIAAVFSFISFELHFKENDVTINNLVLYLFFSLFSWVIVAIWVGVVLSRLFKIATANIDGNKVLIKGKRNESTRISK